MFKGIFSSRTEKLLFKRWINLVNVTKLAHISQILPVTLEHAKVSERRKYANVRNAQKPFSAIDILRLI